MSWRELYEGCFNISGDLLLSVNQLMHACNGIGLSWVRIACDIVRLQTMVYAPPQNNFKENPLWHNHGL
jgi:hypothetical protein